MTVEVQSYTQGVTSGILFPVNISNVVATLKGSEDAGRVYVVSGHYDSRVTNLSNYIDNAPGADDEYASPLTYPNLTYSIDSPTVPQASLFPWSWPA